MNAFIWVTHFWLSALGGLSSTHASQGAGRRVGLGSPKDKPHCTVYGETYCRSFGDEGLCCLPLGGTQPGCQENLLAPQAPGDGWGWGPAVLSPTTLPQAGSPASWPLGSLPPTLSTSRPFLFQVLCFSPAFSSLVSSHALIHSYLLSGCRASDPVLVGTKENPRPCGLSILAREREREKVNRYNKHTTREFVLL